MGKCGFNTFLRSPPSLTCQPAERGIGVDHLPAVCAVGVNEHHAVIECVQCTLQVAVGGGKLGVILGLGLREGGRGGSASAAEAVRGSAGAQYPRAGVRRQAVHQTKLNSSHSGQSSP